MAIEKLTELRIEGHAVEFCLDSEHPDDLLLRQDAETVMKVTRDQAGLFQVQGLGDQRGYRGPPTQFAVEGIARALWVLLGHIPELAPTSSGRSVLQRIIAHWPPLYADDGWFN